MINLHPESNLKENIITLGAELINCCLNRKDSNELVFIDELFEKFSKKTELKDFNLFIETLTFLYLLGVIDLKGYKIKLLKYDNN